MTFLDLERGVYQRLNKSLTPDPVTQARIQTFLNDRYRQLLRQGGIDVRDETLTIVSEPTRARYALPSVLTEIYNVVDTTNRITLKQTSLGEIRRFDQSVPAQNIGTPTRYAILNEAGIAQQPSVTTAGALELVGTSASDTQVVTIEYRNTISGFQIVATTMTGLVPVTVAPAIREVYRLSVPLPPVGVLTLREIVSGQVIASLSGALTGTLHRWVLHLWPTPAGPYTYAIDYARPRRPLVFPSDEPAIPEEFHTSLVYGACAEEAVKMDDTRARTFEAQYQADVKRFRAFLHQARGQRWIPNTRRRAWNDLGAYYGSYGDGGGF